MSKRIAAITPQPILRSQVAKFMTKRPRDSHKGMFGTVAVIGGNTGMVGAALLAGRAAHKLGAGCVHVGLLAANAPSVDLLQPELMLHSAVDMLRSLPYITRPHPNGPLASLSPAEREGTNVKTMFNPDVLAVGCGMGRDPAAQKVLHDALCSQAALVLDADALNILAMRPDLRALISTRTAPCVVTPHPGEAARLLACSTDQVQANRLAAVQQLTQRLGCSVVLKGADSLCATTDGKFFINSTGNAGMSSAGMGDVLNGMIAAFIAQGLSGDEAMLLAVHLHGAAGDALAAQQATIGMTATEVTEWARWLLNQWV